MPFISHITHLLDESVRSMRDFLFPQYCLVCGKSCRDDCFICGNCHDFLSETAAQYVHDRDIPEILDEAVILLPYGEASRSVVHALKYQGIQNIGPFLGRLMARKLLDGRSFATPPLIVPVPLHDRKLALRGYNQAERLAEGVADSTGFTMDTDILYRAHHTGTQTALGKEDRRENVKGVFRCKKKSSLRGRPVILVDDVMTTGSTLAECAHALKEHGASRVIALVVATPGVKAVLSPSSEGDPPVKVQSRGASLHS